MIDITQKSNIKYTLFGTLYFSEGIIYALATVILPPTLEKQGMPLPLVTLLIGITWTPWIIKFIPGIITDHFNKRGRKKFIIIGGATAVISYLILSIINPATETIPFVILLTIGHTGIVFLDVSADAWAIEICKEKERGKVNAAMFGGLFIGMAIGSATLGTIAQQIGYTYLFLTTSLIILLIILLPLNIKEKITPRKKEQKVGKILTKEFKKRNNQLISIFAPISAISFGLLTVVVPLYMSIEFNKNLQEIGLYLTAGPITTFIGAIIGGISADKYGRKKTLYLFYTINIIFAAALILADDWIKLVILYAIVGFIHGGAYTAFGALLMDNTNPKVGATQYSIYTSLANIGEMGGATISGTSIAILGFSRTFLYAGWLYGPVLLLLYKIKNKEKK